MSQIRLFTRSPLRIMAKRTGGSIPPTELRFLRETKLLAMPRQLDAMAVLEVKVRRGG